MYTKYSKKEFTAYNIIEEYNRRIDLLIPGLDGPSLFLEVDTVLPAGYEMVRNVDWWEKETVAERSDSFRDQGAHIAVYWQTKKGILETADALWEYREDRNKVAAIFIQAFIKNNGAGYIPEHWQGASMMFQKFLIAFAKVPELHYRWDYRVKHLLPESPTMHFDVSDVLAPKTMESLVTVIALDTILMLQKWQLVVFRPFTKSDAVDQTKK